MGDITRNSKVGQDPGLVNSEAQWCHQSWPSLGSQDGCRTAGITSRCHHIERKEKTIFRSRELFQKPLERPCLSHFHSWTNHWQGEWKCMVSIEWSGSTLSWIWGYCSVIRWEGLMPAEATAASAWKHQLHFHCSKLVSFPVHQNYIGNDAEKSPFFLSVTLSDQNNQRVPQYRAILWRKTVSDWLASHLEFHHHSGI